jgi:LPXTG-motif cell wall-anchored protein
VLANGTIEGRVFIDRDRDGDFGSGDIGLANVPIRLWSASDYAASSGQAAPAAFDQAILSVGGEGDLATGAQGIYRFDSVSPGAYVVVSNVSLASFHYSFDTDGGEDWIVAVDVQLDQIAQAQFAGVSTEVLTGSVDLASLAGARSLTCWWYGQDGRPSTADDQLLDVPVDDFGNFQVTGVPHGSYACDVGGASVPLASQLPGDVGRSATVSTPVTPLAGVLPQTGGGWSVAPAGAAALAVGGALIVLARRRPRVVS